MNLKAILKCYCFFLTFQELFNDLQKFLETEKDELILELPNPPLKKIRLQEDGMDNLSGNGEEGSSATEDEIIASEASDLRVCNVCLGILQEFCEKEFVAKVNNLSLIDQRPC